MTKSEIKSSLGFAGLGLLILIIGLTVIPKDGNGYAERPIDVMFIIMLFAVCWAASSGIAIGAALFPSTHQYEHPSGPSYRTKDVDGITVREENQNEQD